MRHSKSTLFLMELIIAILFFALASTVCIQLFSKSHLLSRQTVNQNEAMIQAQNMAEIYLATKGELSLMTEILEAASYDTAKDSLALYFNKDWEAVQSSQALYCARLISKPEENGLISALITVYSLEDSLADNAVGDVQKQSIYELTVFHHIAERRGNLEK